MAWWSPAVAVAVVGGVAICFQSLFSGVIGSKVGVMESVFIVHAGGLLLSGAILAFLRGETSRRGPLRPGTPWGRGSWGWSSWAR